MKTLPASPDLSHLKKQAKQFLRAAAAGDEAALHRIADTLPSARAGFDPQALKLHDAQSVLAREYSFLSWTELKRYVEWKRRDAAERLRSWLLWVLDGNGRERALAVRLLRDEPALFDGNAWLACSTGNVATLADALERDPDFARKTGGVFGMPPLLAVTHSRLIQEEGFEAPLLASARLLLEHGADVNGTWTDQRYPDDPLSVLYGAAGRTHNAAMTKLLLDAGALPDDRESLYHSVESRDPACTRLLLGAGVRVEGTNAMARALDYDRLDRLKMLLEHGGNANEGRLLHHAILRGRSLDHIKALADAGADLSAKDRHGISVYRFARLQGRADIETLLKERGIEETLSPEEAFVAACTAGDETTARYLLNQSPDMISRLDAQQLETLPRLAGIGEIEAVRTMLALGWPREVKTGWHATALNHAVFQGDADMARLLLEEGAGWQTRHGFGDTVIGTLSWASQANDIGDPAPRDYVGCAKVLHDHGIPPATFESYTFSIPVTEYLAVRAEQEGS